MGIRGLQTFITQYCPSDCCYQVDIKDLVKKYKEKTSGREPVIVVDGSSCIEFILYKGLDRVSGGQFKEYIERIREFVKAFKQIGVRLVFFFGDGTVNDKRKTWVKRNVERLEKVFNMFDKLAGGDSVASLDKWATKTPPGITHLSPHFFKHILGCEVHQAVDEDDTEIADYARKEECFAIMGQDTDYLIYDGGMYYLSAEHLDYHTMRTIVYDQENFAKHLRLQKSQLPLFATLAGNDLVSFTDLKEFHKTIIQQHSGRRVYNVNFQHLFPALAQYVRPLPIGETVFKELTSIGRKALNDDRSAPLLERSIRTYLPLTENMQCAKAPNCPGWNAILLKAEELHRNCQNVSTVFATLNGEPFEYSTAAEDFRRGDLPPFASVLRPMRQRIYGILFHEKPSHLEPQSVLEWCMEGFGTLNRPNPVAPIPPSVPHPGLLALWSDDQSEKMQSARWRLFASGISPRLNPQDVKDLPNSLVLPTCVLFYIKENESKSGEKILDTWEIEALIATFVSLPSISVQQLAKLPPDPVDLRAVCIATLFTRSLWSNMILLSACGYPVPPSEVFIHPYFDGKLFQQKYRQSKDNSSPIIMCENQASNLKLFQQVRKVLLNC